MSYSGTAICEISHLMLIAVSPIASQHRFHNAVHDFCILYQNVWIKLIWQLKFIFKTPMLVWKETSTPLYLNLCEGIYFLFVTLQHLSLCRPIQWWSGQVAPWVTDDLKRGCSCHVTAMSLTRLLSKPSHGRKRDPTGTAKAEMREALQGLLTSQQFYVLKLSKGRGPEKLPSSPAWKWIWDIPLLAVENKGF